MVCPGRLAGCGPAGYYPARPNHLAAASTWLPGHARTAPARAARTTRTTGTACFRTRHSPRKIRTRG